MTTTQLYKKYFTIKEWRKFDRIAERENGIDITFQEILLKKYDVILTDYQTKKEKIIKSLDMVSPDSINKYVLIMNKGLNKFDNYVNRFDKVIKQFDEGLKIK